MSVYVLLWCLGPALAGAEDAPAPRDKPSTSLLKMFGIPKGDGNGADSGKGKVGKEPPCPDEDGKGDGKGKGKGGGIFCPIPGQGDARPKVRPSAKISVGPGFKVEPEASPLAGQVGAVVGGHKDALLVCYNTGLDDNWELAGRLKTVFSVQPDGTVTEVVIADDTVGDKGLAECVVKVFGSIRFAPPGWLVKVTCPVLFSAVPRN